MSKQYAEMERLLRFLQMCLVRWKRSLVSEVRGIVERGTMEGGAARGARASEENAAHSHI